MLYANVRSVVFEAIESMSTQGSKMKGFEALVVDVVVAVLGKAFARAHNLLRLHCLATTRKGKRKTHHNCHKPNDLEDEV